MDLSTTTEPDSTQVNADDLIAGPQTYTITKVTAGSSEQPVNVHLAETDRHYRPSKSMRRVLVAAWGKDSTAYEGRRITLYRDPEVKFGRDTVGGIKISHLSHIDKPMTVALTVTRGKRNPHRVDPLADAPTLTDAQIAQCDDLDQLTKWWRVHVDKRPAIEARGVELKGGDQ